MSNFKDTIVTTIMFNLGLYKVGIKYEKTKVGDKYVNEIIDAIEKQGYLL